MMSNNVSFRNFKVLAEVLIQERLNKIQSGDIQLNVANQHDEYVLENALENLRDDEVVASAANLFKDADWNNLSATDLAYSISSFHPEPLNSSWVD